MHCVLEQYKIYKISFLGSIEKCGNRQKFSTDILFDLYFSLDLCHGLYIMMIMEVEIMTKSFDVGSTGHPGCTCGVASWTKINGFSVCTECGKPTGSLADELSYEDFVVPIFTKAWQISKGGKQ